MLADYLERPWPLIWRGQFGQAPGESLADALRRNYSQLLRQREQQYERWSTVLLDYRYYRQPTLTVEQPMQDIRAAIEHGEAVNGAVRRQAFA